MSTRASATAAWGAPTPVAAVNSASTETTPDVSADGLLLHLGSARPGGPGGIDCYVATRASRASPWSLPALVPELSSTGSDTGFAVAPDLLTVFFSSDRPGGAGGVDLYTSERGAAGAAWPAPAHVVALATGNLESDPTLDAGRTVIYFDSDRAGGAGGWDLWRATRPDAASAWGALERVVELNGPSSEGDPWLSPDQRTIFFSSDRGGNWDLYVATR